MGRERVEDLGGDVARSAHPREAIGPVQLDDSALRFDAVVGSNGDVLSHCA